VQHWVAWYRAGGLVEVRRHRMGGYGQSSRLTPEQQERLAQEVATGRFPHAAAIHAWVAETFGVTYTEGGMYSLLERLHCAPKVPRPLQTSPRDALHTVAISVANRPSRQCGLPGSPRSLVS